ncbi:MAG: hypothetical protein KC478_14455 [Bacteriovoracaceae bacterium]|nr:hypothetical protein [Bacteriovoracaceae bacterium]
MKNLITTLILSVSFSAIAGSGQNSYIQSLESLSLSELSKEVEGVELENDKIWFEGSQVSIVDVCMSDAETFRTIEKRDIEEYDGDDFEVVGYDYLYKSIYGTETYVDGDGTVDVAVTYPTTREIKVIQSDSEFGGEFLFSRTYTVPACN